MSVDLERIHAHCLSFPGVVETHPFGNTPICYRLHGKIFAMLFHTWDQPLINLKCRRDMSFFYRSLYPDQVIRAYHLPDVHQPYWFSVRLDGFPQEELFRMIGEAYEALRLTLPKSKHKNAPD